MKILITGGAGYLGSVITNRMLQEGYEVVVLDKLIFNQTSLLPHCSNPNFKFIYGDVRNQSLLKKLCNEVDVIIPLAAIVGFPACDAEPELANQINYEQIVNIVEFTKDRDVKILYPDKVLSINPKLPLLSIKKRATLDVRLIDGVLIFSTKG
jgi:nucleoside-diphosphate-sugar epimerase